MTVKKSKALTPLRATPMKITSEYNMRRMNHEAFHIEQGDYKTTIRFELITEDSTYRKVLHADGKVRPRFRKDQIGNYYRSYRYFYKVPSIYTSKGYRFEDLPAEYAKDRGIYRPPEILTPEKAKREINKLRKGINPYHRMTTKYVWAFVFAAPAL